MFVNTGSRKPKSIMSVEFSYDPYDTYYSRKKVNALLYTFGSNNYVIKENFVRKHNRLLAIVSEEKINELLLLSKKYDGRILFLYDSPNKKNKTHKVSFYIIPKDAFAYEKNTKSAANKPYSNPYFYLKSDVILPDNLTSGSPFEKKEALNKIMFTESRNAKKQINVKYNDYTFSYERKFDFNEKVKALETGLYLADVDGVNHYLGVDKDFHGSKDYPHFTLFEYDLYSKEEADYLKSKGVLKFVNKTLN